MLPVAIIKSKVTFKTPYYECYEQDVNFGDFSKKYYVVDFNRTAAVICVNENNEVLITRQYRLLLNRISFEIAGGGLDDGDTFESAAIRELMEETSVRALELISLCQFSPGLDIVDNFTQVFYVKILKLKVSFNLTRLKFLVWSGLI